MKSLGIGCSCSLRQSSRSTIQIGASPSQAFSPLKKANDRVRLLTSQAALTLPSQLIKQTALRSRSLFSFTCRLRRL